MATKQTVLKTLALLYATYPHAQHASEYDIKLRAELWIDLFSDVPDDAMVEAAKRHCKEGTFFPVPAELFKHIRAMEELADGGNDWTQSWSAVKGAIGRYGAWGTAEEVRTYLGDKLPAAMAEDTATIIQRLGWRELCSFDLDQEGMWRAQFRDVYNRVRTTRIERQRMTPDVARLISDMAQKMAADRLRLSAPKNDEEEAS